MAQTLESRLYDTLKKNPNPNTVKELIDQGADCNLSYFDGDTHTFNSPIQMAIPNDRHQTLFHLYEHRNSPTKTQLKKHLTFYINRHVQSPEEENEIHFDYTMSRLLYMRITEHHPLVFKTLTVALNDIDNATLGKYSLCAGSTQEILLQLRIFTLFRKIIELMISTNDDMLTIVEDELLHNLETYYFLDGIRRIPVIITTETINKKFTEIKSMKSLSLLITYYQHIAKNVISKIEQLGDNKEYTIPTGWIGHAVCVSFRRISETHISIRIDNPTSCPNPFNTHTSVHSMESNNQIRPKVLGQLLVNDLKVNLDYFILLIDSVKRDLKPEEGISLIYNLKGQIRRLDEKRIEDVPSFDKQADANCFVKCFEPGFWIRLGRTHEKLYNQLLRYEKDNTNLLVDRRKGESLRLRRKLFDRFILLAREDNISSLSITSKTHLQDSLKTSYQQKYQYLLSSINGESNSRLTEKYIPLRFTKDKTPIELNNFFSTPRVLLLGEAGCGKTTICQYATYLWAQGKLWRNEFEWLFYIKMRNLNSKLYPPEHNYSLIDIIERECFRGYKLNILDKKKLTSQFENPSNILWILDGCDERMMISDHLRTIEQEFLDKHYLLLTSRPYETHDLQCDVRIKVEVFEYRDIKTYITNYFPAMFKELVKKCWSFICDSEQLRDTARIPVCLEIMCNLWEKGEEIFDWDLTTGKLYQKICDCLLRQYLLKFHGQCKSALVGKDIYQQPDAIAFTHLEYLAFQATKSHRFIISEDELVNVAGSQSVFESLLKIGLLTSKTQNPSFILTDNTYYFVHRSFQEYLCARYMIRALSSASSNEEEKEVVNFITGDKYNRLLQNIFRIFFELKRSTLSTDKFWSAVDSEPRDLIGIRHCSRIGRWFPNGICIFSSDDEEKINKRTIDAVQRWIVKKDRRAHDYSNKYLFEWFEKVIPHEDWLEAWTEDLFVVDSSERRYFLPDLWSENHIKALKKIYHKITEDVKRLHRLIIRGPNTAALQWLGSDSNLPTLSTVDDQTETSKFMRRMEEKMKKHEPITSLSEFQELLQNYAFFAKSNRQLLALDKETWRFDVAPSALENIDNETLKLLSKRIEENALFFRYLKLPVISFLKLYAKQNELNDGILRSLIVSITLSTEYLLIAPPGEKKLIRIFQDEKPDGIKLNEQRWRSLFDIKLDEQRWRSLVDAFNNARDEYGFSYFEIS